MSKTQTQQNGWQEVKLGDVANVIGGGTPKTTVAEYWNGDIPWLTPRDLTGYTKIYIERGERNITELGLKKSSARLLPKGAVLLTSRAPIGYLAIAKNEISTNQGFKSLVLDQNLANNLYVYYWLKSNIDYLQSMGTGSTFAEISGSVVKEIQLLLPPLSEQKAIAEVLSSLDDKIDLLHRQNKTLEDMAQALFRKWFIEEAKEDWKEVKLGDYFPVVTGKKDANFSSTDGQYPFFTCAQGILKAPNYSFEGSAILLAGNGDFNVKRYVGKFEAYQRTYVLIPYEKKFFGFLYTLIKYHLDSITGGAQGSVISFITKGMITEFQFSIPKKNFDEKLEKFNEFYTKIDANQFQIRTLETLRDTLLPKLMSGAVKVRFN